MNINLFLQNNATPFLDKFFLGVSAFTNEYIYVALVIFIYYFVNKRKGIKAAFVVSFNLMLNLFLKNIFAIPRPYVKNSEIVCKDIKQGYGYSFPSGHSQLNSAFFTSLHMLFGGEKLIPFSAAFVFLTAFSRVYLGVHSVADVAAGIFLGCLISVSGIRHTDIVFREKKYILFAFSLIGIADVLLYGEPDSIKTLLLYIGFVSGYILEDKFVAYTNPKRKTVRLLECFLCFAGIIIIRLILNNLPGSVRYIQYLLIGSWASFGFPGCIITIRKAAKKRNEQKNA